MEGNVFLILKAMGNLQDKYTARGKKRKWGGGLWIKGELKDI